MIITVNELTERQCVLRGPRIDPASARSEPFERVLAQWSQLTYLLAEVESAGIERGARTGRGTRCCRP